MKGNRVVIKKGRMVYSGTIISYADYGYNEHDRYIEFLHDENSAGNGYANCKEIMDGVDSIQIYCATHGDELQDDFERMYCLECESNLQDEELKYWKSL